MQGSEYPPHYTNHLLSRVCMMLQWGAFIFMMFGESICGQLGVPVPQFYYTIQQKKFLVGMGIFFLGNQLQASLLSTGAFEIFVNDALVFSKLESGSLPTLNLLAQKLAQHGVRI